MGFVGPIVLESKYVESCEGIENGELYVGMEQEVLQGEQWIWCGFNNHEHPCKNIKLG